MKRPGTTPIVVERWFRIGWVRARRKAGGLLRRVAEVGFLIFALLLIGPACMTRTTANDKGCRPDLGGKTGAQVTAQVLRPGSDGKLAPVGSAGPDVDARSGDTIRLTARPIDGPFRPSGAECPLRVSVGKLSPVGELAAHVGSLVDEDNAYALVAPSDERVFDVVVKPFGDWAAAPDQIGIENVTVHLPETGEFVGRLPAPFQPSAGTVCVDALDTAARPAAGITVGLAMPADGPRDARQIGPDGRVCWDGLDPARYGDVSLLGNAEPALGLPKARYVSAETSYRLFVVKAAVSP